MKLPTVIKKLEPKAGDILVFVGVDDMESADVIQKAVAGGKLPAMPMIFCNGDQDVKLVSPKPGDVLVFQGDFDSEGLGIFHDMLIERSPGVSMVIMYPNETLETADQERMNAAGWFRRIE